MAGLVRATESEVAVGSTSALNNSVVLGCHRQYEDCNARGWEAAARALCSRTERLSAFETHAGIPVFCASASENTSLNPLNTIIGVMASLFSIPRPPRCRSSRASKDPSESRLAPWLARFPHLVPEPAIGHRKSSFKLDAHVGQRVHKVPLENTFNPFCMAHSKSASSQ